MNEQERVRVATGQQPNHRPRPRDALVKAPVGRPHQQQQRQRGTRGSNNDSVTASTSSSRSREKKDNSADKSKETLPMASFSELFSFFETRTNKLLFALGCFAGVLNGLVYPILAYLFSNSFSDLGGAADGMASIRNVAFQFLVVGAYAFAVATVQTSCLEVAASRATMNFRKRWFAALLRQDCAFFDLHDVSGLASTVGSSATKVRRGLGRKFGEGIQFFTTFVGGLIYAFYASWRVALVVIGVLPFVSISALAVMKINQSQTARATKAYTAAGGVAYQTVSAIRTVLSLNAVPEMIRQYKDATMEAYRSAISPLWKQGLVNGSMLGSFIILYCILTLYGSYLLYTDIASTGCDASAGVTGVPTCGESGPSVFGAMLGAAFAAQGMSQVANVIEAVTAARTACATAMVPIRRTLGSPEEIVIAIASEEDFQAAKKQKAGTRRRSSRKAKGDRNDGFVDENDFGVDEEKGIVKKKTAVLPKYMIDSSHHGGLKPPKITGSISFKNIRFAYPTRPDTPVFQDFNLDIKAGTTIALVGPSGGGKSTTVGLVNRFYDPAYGTVQLNGIDLKLFNVHYLRTLIGYVGQEPTLFATTVAGNIRYGKPHATMSEIEAAAQKANAHDFICSLPDGYETQVGDKGSQLSGGQKQRIAIARVLVANPKVLILDEATSALDSESELVVQEALDKLLVEQRRTTIIIAHRLTTIRNADTIAVIAGGKVVERGTHQELMESRVGMYRNLVEKQEADPSSAPPSRSGSALDVAGLGSRRESYVDLEVQDGGTRRSMHQVHQLKFCNVTFAYPTRKQKKVMDGFNLSIRKGETLALVGPSGGGEYQPELPWISLCAPMLLPSRAPAIAVLYVNVLIDVLVSALLFSICSCMPLYSMFIIISLLSFLLAGKSTTVSLIQRFYDPLSGTVDFEGVDVKDLNLKWLRDQIGFVQQEPVLFNASISKNIGMGCEHASRDDIIAAAKMANCHDFISAFPEGYDTEVGERGTQLSGGQKQRIAIARALVKNPKILLLDEATSALDTDSERIVQEALDALMASHDRTTIVIAHRLSTIRNADRIAFVSNGKVREIGSHEELMEKPNGRYKRLVASQKRGSTVDLQAIKDDSKMKADADEDQDERADDEGKKLEEEASKAFDGKRARQMAKPDIKYLLVGALGAILAGGVFPAWGIMFAFMIELLFRRTEVCPAEDGSIPFGFDSCDSYYDNLADDMQQTSYSLGIYWAVVAAGCLIGNALVFYGFGMSSERLNKRVRDSAFGALVRQEVAFFDRQSVGGITSQLQDDAARIHTFSGEPIRSLIMSLSSVVTGLIVSFVYMWPFALVSLGTIPFMGFATSVEMKTMYGEDEDGGGDGKENLNSPGGIIVETLLNIRTVASLNMERQRYNDYVSALHKAEPRTAFNSIKSGATSGLSMIIQQWSNALQFWWGGWLLFNYPDLFTFEDFLVSMFALLFSLFALGAATMGASDKKECEKAAGRIFYLLGRESEIDPLSKTGTKICPSSRVNAGRANSTRRVGNSMKKSDQ